MVRLRGGPRPGAGAGATGTKTEAIHQTISAFLRRKQIEGLLPLEGKVHLYLDWREMEAQELKAQAEHERLWNGRR